jgi:hypothetical protein
MVDGVHSKSRVRASRVFWSYSDDYSVYGQPASPPLFNRSAELLILLLLFCHINKSLLYYTRVSRARRFACVRLGHLLEADVSAVGGLDEEAHVEGALDAHLVGTRRHDPRVAVGPHAQRKLDCTVTRYAHTTGSQE